MLTWLISNLATVIITIVLAAVVTAVIVYMRREKKRGNHSCGGNCAGCSACPHGSGTPGGEN